MALGTAGLVGPGHGLLTWSRLKARRLPMEAGTRPVVAQEGRREVAERPDRGLTGNACRRFLRPILLAFLISYCLPVSQCQASVCPRGVSSVQLQRCYKKIAMPLWNAGVCSFCLWLGSVAEGEQCASKVGQL